MQEKFRAGLRDGLPIAMGYLAVSFGFGVLATSEGLPVWFAVFLSMTNLTSAGQLAGLGILTMGGGYLEMIVTQAVINVRYALMSVTLSQKTDRTLTLPHRFVVSACVTDEVFGVAAAQKGQVGKHYFYGLILPPYFGWALGTLCGAALGNVLPYALRVALGIALYAMFIAIVVPPAKEERGVLCAAIGAIACSCLLYYVPAFSHIPSGFAVILSAVPVAAVAAWLFPREESEATQ